MRRLRFLTAQRAIPVLLGMLLVLSRPGGSWAQSLAPPVQFHVSKAADRLDMTVNTSRVLTLDGKIPRVFVSNPEILQASPLSPNQVQVSALKPGISQLNLWDDKGNVYALDVVVLRDATELLDVLRTEFPEATLHVRPVGNDTVYLSGYVPRPTTVDEIVSLARAFYPNVVNGITVGGVQQVALHVKVMEVSRTKLRQLGLDWDLNTPNLRLTQGSGGLMAKAFDANGLELAPGIGGDTMRFRLFNNFDSLQGFLQALRQHDLVKLLAEPTLITMTGRPATFLSGGSFPILVPSGLGTVSVEFREYGTRVDFVPIVVGNGNIRLQVRPSVSDIDESRGVDLNGTKVPGLTQRHTDTEVEMRAGQTVALAGLIQNRVEGQNKGIPLLADLPWVGRAFSRVEEKVNEVELLIIVTPELVGPLEAHQVPQCGPGQLTTSPSDCELYGNGYLEVPNCCLQGKAKNCRNCPPGAAGPAAAETSAPPGASGQDPTTEAIPTKAKAAEPPRSRNHEAQRRKNSGTMWSMSPGTPAPASPIVPSASATPVSVTPAAPNYRSPAPATHASTSPQAAPAGAPQFIGPLGYDPLR